MTTGLEKWVKKQDLKKKNVNLKRKMNPKINPLRKTLSF